MHRITFVFCCTLNPALVTGGLAPDSRANVRPRPCHPSSSSNHAQNTGGDREDTRVGRDHSRKLCKASTTELTVGRLRTRKTSLGDPIESLERPLASGKFFGFTPVRNRKVAPLWRDTAKTNPRRATEQTTIARGVQGGDCLARSSFPCWQPTTRSRPRESGAGEKKKKTAPL